MKILYIYSLMFHRRTWERAAASLARDGICLCFADQASAGERLEDRGGESVDLLIAELSPGTPGYKEFLHRGSGVKWRLGLSPEMSPDFTTFPPDDASLFMGYVDKVSLANYMNGIRFLAARIGMAISYESPTPVLTTGIYHPRAFRPFRDAAAYRAWFAGRLPDGDAPWIGLLFYYSQMVEENTADVDALILALEFHGLAPLCVFTAGVDDTPVDDAGGPPWLGFFRSAPAVDLVLNLMAGRLLKTAEQVSRLQMLDVPIIQLLRSHSQTPEQWQNDPRGISAMTAVYSLAQPETSGVAAPIMIAGTEQAPSGDATRCARTFVPIEERIRTLCRRVRRWVKLRRMANRNKRVTFVLHNNPCKGAEATVGMAVGLDTFESLSGVLQVMKAAGYDVGRAPLGGREILDDILDRKAVAEFRWTTVDEIIAKGGALYTMDADEYGPWFDELPEPARRKVVDDWGEFPGQGMVYRDNGVDVLVITGLIYGNIRIMAQPKRGCYGAKCTGEVCRILHDPELAPPHHWLATYKYIQENSDVVVHFGTGGALEFLPGKQAGLSAACFPEVSMGDLPNLYVYVMDATGEGLMAKRRGQAVVVDHLTPVYRPAPMDEKVIRLEELMAQYQKAEQMGETARKETIGEALVPLLMDLHLVALPPAPGDLPEIVDQARRQIVLARQALIPEGMHLLGTPPDARAMGRLLATLLRTPLPPLPDMAAIADWVADESVGVYDRAAGVLARMAAGQNPVAAPVDTEPLRAFCRDVAGRLNRCNQEIAHLVAGLAGRFIPPGLSGSLNRGRVDLLPTGRNFFATDVSTLPTRAAWEVGRRMADKLLARYLRDERRFPEHIGVNIWSTDAFKSDGELLCQILHLMGVRPVWHPSGRVTEVAAIPLAELILESPAALPLLRPRVDVTMQTSGIMRDLVPNFCELLDRAVSLISNLDEPEDRNFIRKHTREQMERLRRQTDEKLSDTQVRRMAALRIFSSAPGTYGLGVGLSLDASAWEETGDLAEIYINWGGHAYGYDSGNPGFHGIKARQLLADQLARIDVAYMKQSSAEYDVLDCGCYAVSQGGMAVAADAMGGGKTRLYWGDSTLPESADVRDLALEIQRTAMAKLLNPAWIEQLRRHGYQGAQAVAGRVNTLFKWSATTSQVPSQLFDAVVKAYILDEENRNWLRQSNPYALEEISRRLLEAASRDLWQAAPDLLAAVQSAALEVEGDMEEIMGSVTEECQGGKVEVLTAGDVEKWDMEWRIGETR